MSISSSPPGLSASTSSSDKHSDASDNTGDDHSKVEWPVEVSNGNSTLGQFCLPPEPDNKFDKLGGFDQLGRMTPPISDEVEAKYSAEETCEGMVMLARICQTLGELALQRFAVFCRQRQYPPIPAGIENIFKLATHYLLYSADPDVLFCQAVYREYHSPSQRRQFSAMARWWGMGQRHSRTPLQNISPITDANLYAALPAISQPDDLEESLHSLKERLAVFLEWHYEDYREEQAGCERSNTEPGCF